MPFSTTSLPPYHRPVYCLSCQVMTTDSRGNKGEIAEACELCSISFVSVIDRTDMLVLHRSAQYRPGSIYM